MSDNVIILGAGFSFDAEVPLLGGFIDRMCEYTLRRRAGDRVISDGDISVLSKALEVRQELDNYHGRATFDDRNLEDVLSILAFNVLGGGRSEQAKLDAFTAAIRTTIELACSVTHTGVDHTGNTSNVKTGPSLYRELWKALFRWVEGGHSMPTIITLNYDLVLERSLFQTLIGPASDRPGWNPKFQSVAIDYAYRHAPSLIYCLEHATFSGGELFSQSGTTLVPVDGPRGQLQEINLFKLHGSLNFPRQKTATTGSEASWIDPVAKPYIVPPVANKVSSKDGDAMWRKALVALRDAKKVTIVGYSLPATDTYMQFFLRAALGPNHDLQRITVFDPVLWQDNAVAEEMKKRYSACFAKQIQSRIKFRPQEDMHRVVRDNPYLGTTRHFVETVMEYPDEVFF